MCTNTEFYVMLCSIFLFLYSELMPFLEKHKGNGLFHYCYVVLHSDCLKPDPENIV